MNSFWILDFEGIRSHEFICDSHEGAYETEARMHSGFEGIRSPEFKMNSWLRMHFGFLTSKAFAAMNSFWILDFEGIRSHEFISDS